MKDLLEDCSNPKATSQHNMYNIRINFIVSERCNYRNKLHELALLELCFSDYFGAMKDNFRLPLIIYELWNAIVADQREWFSGKIQRCHRWAPSSILGSRISPFCFPPISTFDGSVLYLVPCFALCRNERCFGIRRVQSSSFGLEVWSLMHFRHLLLQCTQNTVFSDRVIQLSRSERQRTSFDIELYVCETNRRWSNRNSWQRIGGRDENLPKRHSGRFNQLR